MLYVGKFEDSGRWGFKATKPTKDGFEVVNLSPEQLRKVPQYSNYLDNARHSKVPNPKFSGYHVRGFQRGLPGGNIEYGLCQALHCEETMVAIDRAIKSSTGAKEEISSRIMALIAGTPGNPATPCGNCRDILLDEFGEDFEIVSGAAEGGLALVTRFRDYLFDDFHMIITLNTLSSLIEAKILEHTLREGRKVEDDPYSPEDVHPERKYFATVVAKDAAEFKFFTGAHSVGVDYHPTYAIEDALRVMRRKGEFSPYSVLILKEGSEDIPPHVMYKDRQCLLEVVDRSVNGEHLRKKDLPIWLANIPSEIPNDTENLADKLTHVWRTSARKWLPMPFTPANLGDELNNHLNKYDSRKKELYNE